MQVVWFVIGALAILEMLDERSRFRGGDVPSLAVMRAIRRKP